MQMQSMRICLETENGAADILRQSEMPIETLEPAKVRLACSPATTEVCAGCGVNLEVSGKFCGQGCEVNFWEDLN